MEYASKITTDLKLDPEMKPEINDKWKQIGMMHRDVVVLLEVLCLYVGIRVPVKPVETVNHKSHVTWADVAKKGAEAGKKDRG